MQAGISNRDGVLLYFLLPFSPSSRRLVDITLQISRLPIQAHAFHVFGYWMDVSCLCAVSDDAPGPWLVNGYLKLGFSRQTPKAL
jgi:hypothetical protein